MPALHHTLQPYVTFGGHRAGASELFQTDFAEGDSPEWEMEAEILSLAPQECIEFTVRNYNFGESSLIGTGVLLPEDIKGGEHRVDLQDDDDEYVGELVVFLATQDKPTAVSPRADPVWEPVDVGSSSWSRLCLDVAGPARDLGLAVTEHVGRVRVECAESWAARMGVRRGDELAYVNGKVARALDVDDAMERRPLRLEFLRSPLLPPLDTGIFDEQADGSAWLLLEAPSAADEFGWSALQTDGRRIWVQSVDTEGWAYMQGLREHDELVQIGEDGIAKLPPEDWEYWEDAFTDGQADIGGETFMFYRHSRQRRSSLRSSLGSQPGGGGQKVPTVPGSPDDGADAGRSPGSAESARRVLGMGEGDLKPMVPSVLGSSDDVADAGRSPGGAEPTWQVLGFGEGDHELGWSYYRTDDWRVIVDAVTPGSMADQHRLGQDDELVHVGDYNSTVPVADLDDEALEAWLFHRPLELWFLPMEGHDNGWEPPGQGHGPDDGRDWESPQVLGGEDGYESDGGGPDASGYVDDPHGVVPGDGWDSNDPRGGGPDDGERAHDLHGEGPGGGWDDDDPHDGEPDDAWHGHDLHGVVPGDVWDDHDPHDGEPGYVWHGHDPHGGEVPGDDGDDQGPHGDDDHDPHGVEPGDGGDDLDADGGQALGDDGDDHDAHGVEPGDGGDGLDSDGGQAIGGTGADAVQLPWVHLRGEGTPADLGWAYVADEGGRAWVASVDPGGWAAWYGLLPGDELMTIGEHSVQEYGQDLDYWLSEQTGEDLWFYRHDDQQPLGDEAGTVDDVAGTMDDVEDTDDGVADTKDDLADGMFVCEVPEGVAKLGFAPAFAHVSPEDRLPERVAIGGIKGWAEVAGLQEGDRLVRIGSKPVSAFTKQAFMEQMKNGARPMQLTIERKADTADDPAGGMFVREVPKGVIKLGFVPALGHVSPEDKLPERVALGGIKGWAEENGLQEGDMLVRVGNQPVSAYTKQAFMDQMKSGARPLRLTIERQAPPAAEVVEVRLKAGDELGFDPISTHQPIIVASVEPGLRVASSGVREGDQLVAIEGHPIEEMEDKAVVKTLQKTRPLRITFEKGGGQLAFCFLYVDDDGEDDVTDDLGFHVRGAPPDTMWVTSVTPNSVAAEAGVRPGDQLVAVRRKWISSLGGPNDFEDMLEERPLRLVFVRDAAAAAAAALPRRSGTSARRSQRTSATAALSKRRTSTVFGIPTQADPSAPVAPATDGAAASQGTKRPQSDAAKGGPRLVELTLQKGQNKSGFKVDGVPPEPVLVTGVVEGGRAAGAGVKEWDELVRLDGKPVKKMKKDGALAEALKARPLQLTFERDKAKIKERKAAQNDPLGIGALFG